MNELETLRGLMEQVQLELQHSNVWEKSDEPHFPKLRVGKKVWKGAFSGEEEIALNIGGENNPTSVFMLYTPHLDQIQNHRITLLGSDLDELLKLNIKSCSFGMIVLVGGLLITKENINQIRRFLFFSDDIEFISLRAIPRKYWLRIGVEAMAKGLSFQDLGLAYFTLFKHAFPTLIERIEIVFFCIKNSQEQRLLASLKSIEQAAEHQFTTAFREKLNRYPASKLRGDCDFNWDCAVCQYKNVCEEIQNIANMRDRDKAFQ
jgi:CO dehydrogenase/acetyl-CoA synthase beta subunit